VVLAIIMAFDNWILQSGLFPDAIHQVAGLVHGVYRGIGYASVYLTDYFQIGSSSNDEKPWERPDLILERAISTVISSRRIKSA